MAVLNKPITAHASGLHMPASRKIVRKRNSASFFSAPRWRHEEKPDRFFDSFSALLAQDHLDNALSTISSRWFFRRLEVSRPLAGSTPHAATATIIFRLRLCNSFLYFLLSWTHLDSTFYLMIGLSLFSKKAHPLQLTKSGPQSQNYVEYSFLVVPQLYIIVYFENKHIQFAFSSFGGD